MPNELKLELPQGLMFDALLSWLLTRGVRPPGSLQQGQRWTRAGFAEQVGRSPRQVSNWLKNESLPNFDDPIVLTIERVFLGTNQSHLPQWRHEIRDSIKRSRAEVGSEANEATPPASGLVFEEMQANIEELLSLARKSGAVEAAQQTGISELAVRNIVTRLGGKGVSSQDLIPWLDSWIETARQTLGDRPHDDDAAFYAAQQEATRRFQSGQLLAASSAFMEELEQEEQREMERLANRKLRKLQFLDEAIKYDELALNPEGAVEKLLIKAELEGINEPTDLADWLNEQGAEFLEHAEGRRIIARGLIAIATFKSALLYVQREERRFKWSEIQSNLALSMISVGAAERNQTRIEEGIDAIDPVLVILQQTPDIAAQGKAYRIIAEGKSILAGMTGSIDLCKQSLALIRKSSDLLKFNSSQLEWINSQYTTARTLDILARLSGSNIYYQDSIKTSRDAIKTLDIDDQTDHIKNIKFALAVSLFNLGEKLNDPNSTQEALNLLETLKLAPQEEYTLYYSSYYASALGSIGYRDSNIDKMRQAADMLRVASSEYTRHLNPSIWEMCKSKLGMLLLRIGEFESDVDILSESAASFKEIIEFFPREKDRFSWSEAQNGLGSALFSIGKFKGREFYQKAATAFHAALEVEDRDIRPNDWALLQCNLGNAQSSIAQIDKDPELLDASLSAYRSALTVFTRELSTSDYIFTLHCFGGALSDLGEMKEDSGLLEEALRILQEAAAIRQRDENAFQWAQTKMSIGLTMWRLGTLQVSAERHKDAISSMREVLEVWTRKSAPDRYRKVKAVIQTIQEHLTYCEVFYPDDKRLN